MFNIAVVGCGNMADTWIEIAMKRNDCKIVALVDIVLSKCEQKFEKYNLNCNIYDSLEKALSEEKINLVFDVTTPDAHFSTVTTALKGGCNVFGEKPMSDSLENAYEMVRVSDETKKEYFVMQNRRYISKIHSFSKFLKAGNLGKVGQISANFQLNPHFGGFREDMESPLIADMAIHTFDAARYLLDATPVSVYCREFNPSWSWYKGDASAICIFEMSDGTIFDYRGSWCTNGLSTSWESEWRVSCEKGSAFWDGAEKLYYDIEDDTLVKTGIDNDELVSASTIKDIEFLKLENEYHQGCINDMFEALLNNTRPQTDCRDNIKSIEMVFKAMESSRTNKVVMF